MANRDNMSFSKAFADARRELGSGKTFTWRGNRYTTNIKGEGSKAPSKAPRPRSRSEGIIGRASAAIDRAEGPRPKPNPRRAEVTRPKPNPRRTPSSGLPSPDSRMPPKVTTSVLADAPAQVQKVISEAPTPAKEKEATRIAEEGKQKRVPGRAIVLAIRNAYRGEGPTDPAVIVRQGAPSAPSAPEAPRTTVGSASRKEARGMQRGGMVKKGDMDRRGKGMFYDSKSPRGYK